MQLAGRARISRTSEHVFRFVGIFPADMAKRNCGKTLGDLVTPKQLGMIRSLAREGDIDAAKECMDLMKCSVSELSKRAASELIDHLQNMQRNGVLPMRRAS